MPSPRLEDAVQTGPCLSPGPIREYRPDYLPAYLSNGLIGLRVGRLPLIDGLCIVNGLVEVDPVEAGEGFSRAPCPLAGDVEVDGHWLSSHPELASFDEQAYDFSCGELRSRFRFKPAATAVRVELLAFCSRSLPPLVLQEVRLQVDADCELTISAGLNHAGLTGSWRTRRTRTPGTEQEVVDGLMEWETHGGLSTLGAAYVTALEGGEEVERRVEDVDQLAPLFTSYRFRARPGRSYVLRQISSLLSSQMHSEPDRQAARIAYLGETRGFDSLREENRRLWRKLWESRVRLIGAGRRWQAIADASFYYLHASAHRSSLFSTSMFGLAYWPNYHYYRGHVMWDIEAFALPVCLLTDPELARAMLAYRVRRLDSAQRNAALNGYLGLQFPWASSPMHGEEVIRLSAPQVAFGQHVTLVVAWAFALFCHVTGDEEYLRANAWPVLSGVANWIESRVTKTGRGLEIRETLGIAEPQGPVNNDAYVNMLAAVVLREAAWAARRLGLDDAPRWEEMARRIFVPVSADGRTILNHDAYAPREGDPTAATPESLAGLFPFGFPADPELERATLRFYLDRVEPFVGRPMLSALLGAWAARLGDRRLSLRLFESGYAEFVDGPFLVTNEFSPRVPGRVPAGPLIANVSGFLSSCLYGLPRLRPGPGEPEGWPEGPAVMPELWEGVEVDRLSIRGRPTRLVARHGEVTRLERLD